MVFFFVFVLIVIPVTVMRENRISNMRQRLELSESPTDWGLQGVRFYKPDDVFFTMHGGYPRIHHLSRENIAMRSGRELLVAQETEKSDKNRAVFWIVATRIPRQWHFFSNGGSVDGNIPPEAGEYLHRLVAADTLRAVMASDGYLVIRVSDIDGVDRAVASALHVCQWLSSGSFQPRTPQTQIEAYPYGPPSASTRNAAIEQQASGRWTNPDFDSPEDAPGSIQDPEAPSLIQRN